MKWTARISGSPLLYSGKTLPDYTIKGRGTEHTHPVLQWFMIKQTEQVRKDREDENYTSKRNKRLFAGTGRNERLSAEENL